MSDWQFHRFILESHSHSWAHFVDYTR